MPDPLTLVVEDGTGVATANTYIDLDRANVLLAERDRTQKWQEADLYRQQQALIAAFHALNKLDWKGGRSTTVQRGAWPRIDIVNRYGDDAFDAATVPEDIQYAQAALALYLLTKDRYDLAEQRAVMSASNAGRSRTVATGHPANQSLIPQEVWGWIAVYVNLTTARLVRAA